MFEQVSKAARMSIDIDRTTYVHRSHRIEPNGLGPGIEITGVGPKRPEPDGNEAGEVEPRGVEPNRTEPIGIGTNGVEPTGIESPRTLPE